MRIIVDHTQQTEVWRTVENFANSNITNESVAGWPQSVDRMTLNKPRSRSGFPRQDYPLDLHNQAPCLRAFFVLMVCITTDNSPGWIQLMSVILVRELLDIIKLISNACFWYFVVCVRESTVQEQENTLFANQVRTQRLKRHIPYWRES